MKLGIEYHFFTEDILTLHKRKGAGANNSIDDV